MLKMMKFDEKYAISNDKNSGNSALVYEQLFLQVVVFIQL